MNPMEEKWDFLIVLDACRYDFFERVYRDYFEDGGLSKVISPGTWTPEWALSVFDGEYLDVVYVSGNTYIRNGNKTSSEIVQNLGDTRPVDLYVSEEHFYRIIDVWNNRWDNGTVHPKDMNEVALYAAKNYPDKRLIVHYMQPHTPYTYVISEREYKFRTRDRINKIITRGLIKVFGEKIGLKINKLLGFPIIRNNIDIILSKNGVEGIRQVYEDNLRFVLKYVIDLIEYFEGKIFITSDHGELLYENGKFGHGPSVYSETRPKELVEVPWFETSRTHSMKRIPDEIEYEEPNALSEEEEEIIKDRLKALGYIE